MKDAFDDLDKNVKEKTKKIGSFTEDVVEFKSVDWRKIAGLVLKLLEKQVPPSTYKLIALAVDIVLKKRSKLSIFLYGAVFTSIQVVGIYKLVQMIINLF